MSRCNGNPIVECCCCGQKEDIGVASNSGWFPCVFHGNEELGDVCASCAAHVGIRDAREDEHYDNYRIRSYKRFVERRDMFRRFRS